MPQGQSQLPAPTERLIGGEQHSVSAKGGEEAPSLASAYLEPSARNSCFSGLLST